MTIPNAPVTGSATSGPFGSPPGTFVVIGGPCSIESVDQLRATAQVVRRSGAQFLRGGIFKMRTDPKSFQGLGLEALESARIVCREMGLPLVSEISDPRQIDLLHDSVDVFQVGTRNMYNYSLLRELGKLRKPVLLKRGFSALVEEWLYAAEYVRGEGNRQVVLCERGIRTFERITRNTLDLSAVAYIKQHSDLPVIVDPSHGTGVRSLVAPMARAAVAAGADGLLIEVHPCPEQALSDGAQTLNFDEYETLMRELQKIVPLFGKSFAPLAPLPATSPGTVPAGDTRANLARPAPEASAP